MIKGSTKVFSVIGDPIEHTLSPKLHNTLIKELNHDAVYVPLHVRKDNLNDAIRGAHALGIIGMNVTIPHKENVMDSIISVDPIAKQIGAVNTLKYTDKGYKGYNTDADGLLQSLEYEGVSIKDQVVVILGAGGASRAVAILCASRGAKKIIIMNRTIRKAEELAFLVKQYYQVDIEIYPINSPLLEKKVDLCIQTTSVGMYPHVNNLIVEDDEFYKKVQIAVDLIYNPSETMFLKKCKKNGARTLNGLGMLVYQGIKSYEIWNEVNITKSVKNKIYEELKNYLKRGL
ncbi:shikimate dehydrogenase [Vallitalea okinawensis]|uniref:shikimate dehydrogenase n=1 Tax=Vallitalea okinawensis TaxID=2078660 RepID=UPI000CFBE774|nr:shikimate dehydrogenase [Vallitalea okinawensis]